MTIIDTKAYQYLPGNNVLGFRADIQLFQILRVPHCRGFSRHFCECGLVIFAQALLTLLHCWYHTPGDCPLCCRRISTILMEDIATDILVTGFSVSRLEDTPSVEI